MSGTHTINGLLIKGVCSERIFADSVELFCFELRVLLVIFLEKACLGLSLIHDCFALGLAFGKSCGLGADICGASSSLSDGEMGLDFKKDREDMGSRNDSTYALSSNFVQRTFKKLIF